jgi:hypothetical protein
MTVCLQKRSLARIQRRQKEYLIFAFFTVNNNNSFRFNALFLSKHKNKIIFALYVVAARLVSSQLMLSFGYFDQTKGIDQYISIVFFI